jgi:hypothetical protein
MRVLTVFDLVAVLLLFAFGSITAVSGELLAILALPAAVGAAVGVIAGRLRLGLGAGVAIDAAFIATAFIALAGH